MSKWAKFNIRFQRHLGEESFQAIDCTCIAKEGTWCWTVEVAYLSYNFNFVRQQNNINLTVSNFCFYFSENIHCMFVMGLWSIFVIRNCIVYTVQLLYDNASTAGRLRDFITKCSRKHAAQTQQLWKLDVDCRLLEYGVRTVLRKMATRSKWFHFITEHAIYYTRQG